MREQLTAGLDISAVKLHLGDRAVEGIDQDRPDIHTDFFLAWSARGLEGIEPAIDRLGTCEIVARSTHVFARSCARNVLELFVRAN